MEDLRSWNHKWKGAQSDCFLWGLVSPIWCKRRDSKSVYPLCEARFTNFHESISWISCWGSLVCTSLMNMSFKSAIKMVHSDALKLFLLFFSVVETQNEDYTVASLRGSQCPVGSPYLWSPRGTSDFLTEPQGQVFEKHFNTTRHRQLREASVAKKWNHPFFSAAPTPKRLQVVKICKHTCTAQ